MMKLLRRLNKQGTILQIVLIIFMVLVLNVGVLVSSVIENSRSIKRVEEINENRLIELTIIRYFKETILNNILFSDEIFIENYRISYTVDDMGDYYYIVTTIEKNNNTYSFNLEINLKSLVIKSFDYQ